jgi:hypothetical protein
MEAPREMFAKSHIGAADQHSSVAGAMRKVLILAAVGEGATGVALMIVPSLVGQLLLGTELAGVALPVARVAGIALTALSIACWPGTPLIGMLTYSAAVTLYLTYLGFTGGLSGILLWPAVILHVILTALLARATTNDKRTKP